MESKRYSAYSFKILSVYLDSLYFTATKPKNLFNVVALIIFLVLVEILSDKKLQSQEVTELSPAFKQTRALSSFNSMSSIICKPKLPWCAR